MRDMEDHGQIITYFEGIFGSYIDHEVIKIILQACDWDSSIAYERLYSLADCENATNFKPEPKSFACALSEQSQKNCFKSQSPKKLPQNPMKSQSNKISDFKKIENLIASNKKLLIIMRGLPGSGKSTLANLLNTKNGVVLSTDAYFYDKYGNYNYNSNILPEAHKWNKDRAKLKMFNKISPIFIDNTNLQKWEFEPYVKLGIDNGYHVEILEPETSWKYDCKELARRCIHNIPKKKIEEMKERFQMNLSIDNLLGSKTSKKTQNRFNEFPGNIQPSNSFSKQNSNGHVNSGSSGSLNSLLKIDCSSEQLQNTKAVSNIDSQVKPELISSDFLFSNVPGMEVKPPKNEKQANEIAVDKEKSLHSPNCAPDNTDEDLILRQCSDLEDKLGKPLSSIKYPTESATLRLCSKPLNISSECTDKISDLTKSISQMNVSGDKWEPSSDLCSWDVTDDTKSVPVFTQRNKFSQRRTQKSAYQVNEVTDFNNDDDEEEDPSFSSWVPAADKVSWEVEEGDKEVNKKKVGNTMLSQTGAIPKRLNTGGSAEATSKVNEVIMNDKISYSEKSTQYLTSDYTENSLKEIVPNSSFVSYELTEIKENKPLTDSKLLLHKGTMTDETLKKPSEEKDVLLARLVSFFPDIQKADFEDILEKCDYDLDWAMNILIDGDYKFSDPPAQASSSECSNSDSSEDGKLTSQSVGNDDNQSSNGYLSDVSDGPSDFEEADRKAFLNDKLKAKTNLESALHSSNSVDDYVRRLTSKEYEELQMNKIKKQKHNSHKNNESVKTEIKSKSEEGEGSQYLTVEVDPLFASQLISIYGPISSLNLTSGFSQEVRRIVLPLEICYQIYQYWAETLEGKFKYEKDVLDKFIREDEELARRLQEEENSKLDTSSDIFETDPPTSFNEIVNLEKALDLSHPKNSKGKINYSEILSLKMLQEEFSHVDPCAVEEEFQAQCCNYQETKSLLNYKYKFSPPKTVVAPGVTVGGVSPNEFLNRESPVTCEEDDWEEHGISVDDPQAYRDEAQIHYLERKKAFQKAQEAFQQGMKSVASYYAQIGNAHMQKFKEANERASKKILNAVNSNKGPNTLDLHLLHVDEALREAHSFLSERKSMLYSKNLKELEVTIITGKGNHSVGGEPRLKPAIRYFLKKEGFVAREMGGLFQITLRP